MYQDLEGIDFDLTRFSQTGFDQCDDFGGVDGVLETQVAQQNGQIV